LQLLHIVCAPFLEFTYNSWKVSRPVTIMSFSFIAVYAHDVHDGSLIGSVSPCRITVRYPV